MYFNCFFCFSDDLWENEVGAGGECGQGSVTISVVDSRLLAVVL
jgi:hypothetical protein